MQKVLSSYTVDGSFTHPHGLPVANKEKNNMAPTVIMPFEWHNDCRLIVIKKRKKEKAIRTSDCYRTLL